MRNLQKIKDIKLRTSSEHQTNQQRYIKKALWLLSTARNAIVVILCSLLVYIYYDPTKKPVVVLTGKVHLR